MKARWLVMTLAFFAVPAMADTVIDIEQLANESGLSKRQVSMVLGARSAYAEYPASYTLVKRKFEAAVGPHRFAQLVAAMRKAQESGEAVAVQVPRPDSGS
ncbi:hypothetical protein [Tahibacter amnicola]|uniref:DUF4148 domain-containing protein n=1 Tax=Tahibacter amnicola TaxID=2976241 RepID=A0ABY6BG09_9GAMM|nr:hypothetical protein [Tahibacter amnicola]UXI68804.1 hypothetical protein N4264_03880 [Tahibacter amnicola]